MGNINLLVELGPQAVDDLLPVTMGSQSSPHGWAYTMSAVELDIKGIQNMASWAEGNTDAVCEAGMPAPICIDRMLAL